MCAATDISERLSSELRLLLVIDRVDDMGGAEGSTTLLLRGLHAQGVALGAVGLDGVTIPDRAELEREGVLLSEPSDPGIVASVRCVLRAIRELRPTLIHATLARSEMAARVAGWIAGVPVITSIVSVPYSANAHELSPSKWKLSAYRAIDGFLARHATFAFHAISEASAKEAVRSLRIDPAKITVVPRGRSDTQLGRRNESRCSRARASLGIPPNAPVIVNIAREDRNKGQLHLLEAVATINRGRREPAHLVVAGRRGSASADLDDAVVRLRLEDCVHRLGVRSDVAELFCAGDVFGFPSFHEGLGGALLEALALELPAVAFDEPAVREAVGDAAVLVPMRDGDAFTKAIADLLDDPAARARLASLGRQRFEDRFTNDRYRGAMIDFYLATASRRSRYRDPWRWFRRRRDLR